MPRVTTDDGVEINYYVDDFTDPWEEEKETLILYHALWENAKFLAPLVPALARKYRVVRPDMRGRGDSTAPPAESTLTGGPDESTLAERQAKDTMCVLDHLGVDQVHWFGQGGGGITGMIAAVWHPERVKSLILSGVPIKLTEDFLRFCSLGEETMYAALEKLGVPEFNQRGVWRRVIDHSRTNPRMESWILAERNKIPLDVMVRTAKWMHVFDYSDWLPKIKCPTLIMGVEKGVVPLEQKRFMAQQIPNAKLVTFEGLGRGVHLFMSDRVVEEILKFLQSLS